MTKLNNTRLAILGFLHYRGMHGYEIKKTIEKWMPGFWSINYGSIYPELRKLEESGFVKGHKEETSKNPPKMVYAITDEGKEEFKRRMKERLEREAIVKDEFNLLASFFDYLDENEIKGYIKMRKEQHEKALGEAIAGEKATRGKIGKYLHALIKRGILHYKAELEWLKELEKVKE
jgi:DNA-binding PadR family transcriptional regulator